MWFRRVCFDLVHGVMDFSLLHLFLGLDDGVSFRRLKSLQT